MAQFIDNAEPGATFRERDQVLRWIRRQTLVLPGLLIAIVAALTGPLVLALPPLNAYAIVLAVGAAGVVLFSRTVVSTVEQVTLNLDRQQTILEDTTEQNVILHQRDLTNRRVADDAIQSIYGAAMRLDSCLDRLQDETGVRDDIDAAAASLTEVIGQIRRYVFELHPVQGASPAKLRISPQYWAQQSAGLCEVSDSEEVNDGI
jgi:signal transduction histidine kinase